ncbi:hypothetical protein BJ742DRAFT_738325 [Cladochytrium replicatum]|nr:hypothetical protein BJ742DRAFT_738325 [Cladochytrium replicatum]
MQYIVDDRASQNVAVGDLAKHGTTKKTKVGGFSLPLSVAILSLLIPPLCLTVIPSSVLLLNAMSTSNDALAGKILTNPIVIATVTGTGNWSADPGLNLWMNSMLDQTNLIGPLIGITPPHPTKRKNLNRDAPSDAPSDMRVNIWWGRNTLYWCDYKNYTTCTISMLDENSGAKIMETSIGIAPSMINNAFTCAVQSSCPKSGGIWKPELTLGGLWLTFGTPKGSETSILDLMFQFSSLAACAPPLAKFGSAPPFSSGSPISAGDLITSIFHRLSPSENARLFLVDETGQLLATSTEGSIANLLGTSFVQATSANDSVIPLIAEDIVTKANSFKSMSSVIGYLIQASLPDDKWTYSVRSLEVPASNAMYLVAAIPRRDFFSIIDSSERASITVTVAFAVVSIIVVILVIMGITFPVRKLTADMSKVAVFDFTMLERGFFVENSPFTEIRRMQRTFNTLVKAL